jgi:hypothetical protein
MTVPLATIRRNALRLLRPTRAGNNIAGAIRSCRRPLLHLPDFSGGNSTTTRFSAAVAQTRSFRQLGDFLEHKRQNRAKIGYCLENRFNKAICSFEIGRTITIKKLSQEAT